jgi:LAGLIDADG endonuclease
VIITFPWLLGFIEGDGSFSFSGMHPRLSIQVTLINKPVLVAINEFFGGVGSLSVISRSSQKGRERHAPEACLDFGQIAFLYNVIVTTFTSLTFYSKKGLDFADWVICVRIYFTGRHTLKEGKEMILLLRSRMNNNRLSSNPNNKRDLVISQERIDGVFLLPAPYEIRKGVRYITGSNKLVPESFPVYVSHPDGSTGLYPSLSQYKRTPKVNKK